MKLLNSKYFFYFCTFVCLLIIYFPIIYKDNLISRDDGILIAPLKSVSSIDDYIQLKKSGKIYDLQPIRDLSFILDLKLELLTKRSFFHLHSMIIWFLCIILIRALLEKISPRAPPWIISLVCLTYAIYPTYSQVLSWVSARKHLLSYFFILATLNVFYRIINKECKITWFHYLTLNFFYCFSILSHPINALIPVWMTIYLYIENRLRPIDHNIYRPLFILLVSMFVLLGTNYYTYHLYSYASNEITGYLLGHRIDHIILSLARYMVQILFPINLSIVYSPYSYLNLIGIPLIVFLYFCSYKILGFKVTLQFFLLYLISFSINILVAQTRNFISDTYLLTGSLSILILFFKMLTRPNILRNIDKFKTKVRVFIPIMSLALLLIGAKSQIESNRYLSDFDLWENAYLKEPHCYTKLAYAYLLFDKNKIEKGVRVGIESIRDSCLVRHWEKIGEQVFLKTTYYSEQLSSLDKINIINNYKYIHPLLKQLFIGDLKLQQGNIIEAMKILSTVNVSNQLELKKINNFFFLKHYKQFCLNSNHPECKNFFNNKQNVIIK